MPTGQLELLRESRGKETTDIAKHKPTIRVEAMRGMQSITADPSRGAGRERSRPGQGIGTKHLSKRCGTRGGHPRLEQGRGAFDTKVAPRAGGRTSREDNGVLRTNCEKTGWVRFRQVRFIIPSVR